MANNEDGVKVCIRARPFINRESGCQAQWELDTHQIKLLSNRDKVKSYIFDRVYSDDETTRDVYEEVAEPIVQSAMQGFHGTIFAYGQTSSGKTYTMLGNTQSPGIIPLAVQDIFDMIQKTPEREFLLRVSYLEIYNENLKDLLASELVPLQIREDEFKHVRVYGLHEEMVTSPKDVMKLMAKGEKLRHMASTNMNDRSSRSHTIFKMIIESRERMDFNKTREDGTDTAVRVAQLNMVDLAGSERASQTGSEGVRLKEGCYINKSLMVLGQVINQICKDNESNSGSVFINFRDSKLTRILQPSLGGNALTVIICTVTLAVVDETDSTLRFASSAKKVKNKPTVNEVLSDEALLYRQKREINQLKKKIMELEQQSTFNEMKQKQSDFEKMLEEKSRLQLEQEDKISMLKQMLLVSNIAPSEMKMKQRLRRETWCPGAISASLAPRKDWHFSPQADFDQTTVDADFTAVERSAFMEDLKVEEKSRLFETPMLGAPKRHLLDIPHSSSSKRARSGGNEGMLVTALLEDELKSMKAKLSKCEEDLLSAREERDQKQEELTKMKTQVMDLESDFTTERKKSEMDLDEQKDRLSTDLVNLRSQAKMQQELIDQFLVDQEEQEKREEEYRGKINRLSMQVVELERREIARIEGNSVASELQSVAKDLNTQLAETCRQKCRIQLKLDEESDRCHSLSISLEKLTQDIAVVKGEADEKEEEYKERVLSLQSQLEASLSATKSPDHSTKFETEISELKMELIQNNEEIENLRKALDNSEDTLVKLKEEHEIEIAELKKQGPIPLGQSTLMNVSRVLNSSAHDSDKTLCLEEAIRQCEILLHDKESMKRDYDDVVFKCMEKEKQITVLQKDILSLREHLEFDANEKEIMFEEAHEKESAIEKYKQDMEQYKTDIDKLQSELQQAQFAGATADQVKVIENLQKDLQSYEETTREAKHRYNDASQKLSVALEERNEFEKTSELQSSKIARLQSDLDSYMAMSAVSGKSTFKTHELNRSVVAESPENVLSKAEVEDLQSEMTQITEKLGLLQQELDSKTAESENLLLQLTDGKVENDIQSQANAIKDKEVSELKEELDNAQTILNQLQQEKDQLVHSETLLKDCAEQNKSEVSKLQELLEERENNIQSLNEELQQICNEKESMESAIEKMREDNQVMQNLVDPQTNKEEEEKLNSQLLTMDVAIGEKEKQISALEEQIKLLTDEKEQKNKEFADLKDAISEKDERIRDLENKERNNTQKEISDAQVQIQVLETQLSEVNEKYSQLNSKYQCREPTTDSVDYGTNIDDMQIKIDELTQSLSQKNCAVENLEETVGSLRHKTTEYREKITELERAVQGLGESNTDLMEKIDFLQKNLSEKEFQLGNVSTMCERHNKEMSEVKNRFESLSEELEQKQIECQQAQEELGMAHSKIQELDSVERGIKPDCNVSVQCETLDSSVSNALDVQEGSEDIVEGLANASDSTGNNEMLDELTAEKKLVFDLQKKVSDLEEQLGAARDRQAKVLEGCEHLSEVEQNFVTLYHQFSELSEQLKSREESNEALNQQLHDAKRDVEQMRIRLEQSIDADAAWKLEDELKALKCDLYKEKQKSEALCMDIESYKEAIVKLEAQVQTQCTQVLGDNEINDEEIENNMEESNNSFPTPKPHVRKVVRFNIVENDVDSPQRQSPEVDPDAEVVINDLKSALESKELEPKELKFSMEENKDEISHLEMIHNLKSTLESKELEIGERNQLLEEMKQKLESLERNQIQESNPEFLEDLKSELESKELEIAEMKLKFESMEENINQRNDLESNLNKLKSQLEEKEFEIEERNRLFEEMERKLESLEEQPHQESNESHYLEQELAQLKEELLEKESSLQLMQDKVKELQANFDSALEKEESHDASNLQLNEELANMKQRLDTFTSLQEEQEQASEKLKSDYAHLVEQLRLAQEEHVSAKDRLVQKEAHVTELSSEIEVLESKLASQEAMVQFLQNELTVFNEKNRVNEVLLDETKEELSEMRNEVNVLLSSVAESQEIKARHEALENELETVKNDNTLLMNEVTELKESLVKSKCEIQSLESDLKYTKTSETDALERAGLAESSIEEKQEQINDLEEKLDQAQQQVKILEDQLMEPDGDHRICEEKVSNLKEEIDILKLEHKRKINEVSALNETTKLIQEELEQVQKSLDDKTDELHRAEKQKQILEEELVVKTADLESSSASLEEQKRMVEALQYEISDLKCSLSDDKSELMKLLEDQENLSEVEKNFIILYQQFSQLSEEQQKLQVENENLKLKISEEQGKEVDPEVIKELEDSLASTKLDLEEKRSKCESLTSELQLLKEELENQSKMNEAKLNELKFELEQNFTCSDKMNNLLQNLEELQENCNQKDAENKALAEEVSHLHHDNQKAQEEFQLLVEGKGNEISSLKSELSCLQSEMKASTQSDLELSELQEKCDKLKAELNQSHELVTKIKDNEKKTVDDLNAKLAELQEKVQSDQHIITSDAEKIRDFGNQVARMKLENEVLTQQISSENEKFNAQREQMEEKCNKSNILVTEKEQMIDDLTKTVAEMRKTHGQLNKQIEMVAANSKLEIAEQAETISNNKIQEHKAMLSQATKEINEKTMMCKMLQAQLDAAKKSQAENEASVSELRKNRDVVKTYEENMETLERKLKEQITLAGDYKDKLENVSAASLEVQQHKEALGRTTQKLLDKTKECNKIQEKLEKLEKVNKDQEKEISDKNMTDLAWSNRCKDLETAMDKMDDEMDELRKVHKENVTKLKTKLSEQELMTRRSKNKVETVAEGSQMAKELEELKKVNLEQAKEINDNKMTNLAWSNRCKDLENAMDKMDDEMDELRKTTKSSDQSSTTKQISSLKEQMKKSTQSFQQQIQDMKDKLQQSDTKMFRLKEQLRIEVAKHDESISTSTNTRMSTRSSTKIAPGGIVHLTKLDVMQREYREMEKELAKYKDIDAKRRAENQKLLDDNNKFRRYLRALKHKQNTDQPAPQAQVAAATVTHEPENKENEEMCKQQ